MVNNSFSQFIEELRIARNLSRDDFLDDIISKRQYQRFLNGESSIKNDVLEKLISRLKLEKSTLTNLYLNNSGETLNILSQANEMFTKMDYKTGYELISKIDFESIQTEANKTFYLYLETVLSIQLKRITKQNGIDKLKDLINYPTIVENTTISYVELNTILYIYEYLYQYENDTKATNFLFKIISSENNNDITKLKEYEPPIFANLAKTLIKMNDLKKAEVIIQKGIMISKKHNVYGSLAHLYYYLAYLYDKTNRKDKMIEAARKMFAILYIEESQEKLDVFSKIIFKHLGIKKEDIFIY